MPSSLDLTPEAALLLACINVSSTPEEKSQRISELLRKSIDWNRFVNLVTSHNLTSIVSPILKSGGGAGRIPSTAFAGLRYWELANTATSERRGVELAAIMTRFEAAGIPALVFKGPALAVVAYGNPTIRAYSDLDILIPRSNVVSAAELLIADGFDVYSYKREVFERSFFSNKSENFYSDRASVDLHWTLQDRWFPFGPDEEVLWSRTENFSLKGRDFRTLGAADHLLFLCVHASKHGWPSLAAVVDVATFLKMRPELNPLALIDEAARLGCNRMVLLAFSLASQIAGASLACEVYRILQCDKAVCRLTAQIFKRSLAVSQHETTFRRWTTAARVLSSPFAQIRMYAAHMLIPIADDYNHVPLPAPLYFLYYLVRPLRIAGRGTSLLFRRLSKL